ncbi:hypothetical protein H0I31_11460 [Tenacibaculum sp. AHE15PA]|uniref:DUF6597 domain-containing transcriptional factor n=1 Tax=unclassified Tenacibaculum TaxID=2635139 RepID=UPI001C4E7140|nr:MULTISPECIES: DUF6597 domain-containing transcriptional factor [unclassified Tenacibaculum]QXP73845.1 hypothetical protein H0I30_01520 [Tenacibaculum sp. AHE14PA]QXP75788.1 hypothetical protein H0I31_11460 [Tenacibaculum sp. AHE15PA]
MVYDFHEISDTRNLINSVFTISISSLPFNSLIVPTGAPSITYIFSEEQQTLIHKDKEFKFDKLIVSGQFDSSYSYLVNVEGYNIGVNLHPSTLYKILGSDISLLKNKHLHLKDINKELTEKLDIIFIKNKNDIQTFIIEISNFIESLDIFIDKDVELIDTAVNYILEKEGMLQVIDLLKKNFIISKIIRN